MNFGWDLRADERGVDVPVHEIGHVQGATNAPEPLQANVFKRSTSLKKFCLLTK